MPAGARSGSLPLVGRAGEGWSGQGRNARTPATLNPSPPGGGRVFCAEPTYVVLSPRSGGGGRVAWLEAQLDQRFGDLDGVERGALAQIVRDNPDIEAVLDGGILADAADKGVVFADAFDRGGVATRLALVEHRHARRLAQDVARLVRADRVLELEIDGFGMADKHRHAHGGAGHLDLGIKDLL